MSEFSLIDDYFKNATASHSCTALGIGDDCAVSHVPNGQQLVSCVDTLVAGRHFVQDTNPYAIAYKSVAVNLSDLASMGATPYAILLGLSLPKADAVWLQAFAQGLADICARFGVELIGGDTTKSPILTISITALGFVPQGKAIRRQGARVGDVVCVSGQVGLASLALQEILKTGNSLHRHALDLPMPQVALGQNLRGVASAMIDISDGLGQDLGHILTQSQVGAVIELDKIPTHQALLALPDNQRWHHLINGGDDYQLCLTISPKDWAVFDNIHPNTLYPIGTITQEQGLRLLDKGKAVAMSVQGWSHF